LSLSHVSCQNFRIHHLLTRFFQLDIISSQLHINQRVSRYILPKALFHHRALRLIRPLSLNDLFDPQYAFKLIIQEPFYDLSGPLQVHKVFVQRVLALLDQLGHLVSCLDLQIIEVVFFRKQLFLLFTFLLLLALLLQGPVKLPRESVLGVLLLI
jgi:hypothetical protein